VNLIRSISRQLAGAVCIALVSGTAWALPVTLAWDPNPLTEGVTAYRIYTCQKASTTSCTLVAETALTQITVETVSVGQCYRGTAVNKLGLESDKSLEVCVDMTKPSVVLGFHMTVYVIK
jgi:fibronectin type 3 domain-containing protein